ncbi:MAG: ABC transporter permease [Clostridia bacterium]|nr:ABC transporter permease [Clostridia bacterium]
MTEAMEGAGVTVISDGFLDLTAGARNDDNAIMVVNVFSYGFITLISLICVANVFNTISTNIALRRRDYAMLRSMGMTEKGLRRMSNYECVIYGAKALMIGLPIAAAVTYLIYKVVESAVVMSFTLPWGAIAIAVISVFAVVFASMLYSTNKLKKGSPIDALKDESA